jgi:hypothetical protein
MEEQYFNQIRSKVFIFLLVSAWMFYEAWFKH